MTTKQMNKIESHRARHALLSTAPEVGAIKTLAGKVAVYGQKLDEIDLLVGAQTQRTAPGLAQRDAAFDAMVDATLAIAGIALSYADDRGIPGLAGHVRVVPTDFRAGSAPAAGAPGATAP